MAAELRSEDAALNLAFLHSKTHHRFGGKITAAALLVLDDVLPEIRQLERGADLVGEQRDLLVPITTDQKHQSAYWIGRVVRVFEQFVPGFVFRLDLIHAEGDQKVMEELSREIARPDRLVQCDEHRMHGAFRRIVTLV